MRTAFGAVIERSSSLPELPADGAALAAMLERERCLVFRGFNATVEAFEAIGNTLSEDFHSYRGGGFTVGKLARTFVDHKKTLMTASGATQEFPMPLHGEMYYLLRSPELIWFYCDVPAQSGGETTIGDGRRIYRDLPAETRQLFAERRIRYERRLAEGDWQATFQAENRAGAEEFCRSEGLEIAWQEDGSAVTRFYTSALRQSASGEAAFINGIQLIAGGEPAVAANAGIVPSGEVRIRHLVRWEDGARISPGILAEIERATSRNEVEVAWRRGDILLVDNRSVMHGRRGSAGAGRRILVKMGNLRQGLLSRASSPAPVW
jgi:alpha-ketoglutarate-dependent taurine dioxygenase